MATLAVVAAVTVWAGDALACPFCTTAKTGSGYFAATVVLLVLPLAALGGFALWVRRVARSQARPVNEEAQPPQSSAP